MGSEMNKKSVRVWAKFDNMSVVGGPEYQATEVVDSKSALMKFVSACYNEAIPQGITVTFKIVPLD